MEKVTKIEQKLYEKFNNSLLLLIFFQQRSILKPTSALTDQSKADSIAS